MKAPSPLNYKVCTAFSFIPVCAGVVGMEISMKNDYSRILTQSEIDELFFLDVEVLASMLNEIRKFENEIAARMLEKYNNEPCGYEICLLEIDVMLFADPKDFE